GNLNEDDGCDNTCHHCPICGDGILDADVGEECDDGNFVNTDSCKNDCTNNVGGDGIEGPGEECDDGDTDDHDTCRNNCELNVCGDGVILRRREQCEDGNTVNHDGCSDDCLSCPNIICGDGIPEGAEQCDDGN